ncbi:MAG: sialidase family protein [Anaerolineae bacterium]
MDLFSAGLPGVVINHSPAVSGCYIGSPSLVLLPNGEYVASHDFFGPKANHTNHATTLIFVSEDKGQTWQQASVVRPSFWGKLFVHWDQLYLLGTSHEYGDLLLRRSKDGDRTWTTPEGPSTGLLRKGRYHCAPCPILIHKDRIWRSMEMWTGPNWGDFEALVMSAPLDAELLAARSWRFSQHLPKQEGFCWLEGNVLLDPDGKVVNALRTNDGGDDKAAVVSVSGDGRQLSFDREVGFIDMPGGGSKFTIRYDPRTARYWSIVNKQTNPAAYRNNLVLTSSADLRNWNVETPLLRHADAQNHAWQYVDWQFEGEDIVFVSRTAFDDGLGGAQSAHDANYLTFHRIKDFRDLGTARTSALSTRCGNEKEARHSR